MKNLNNIILQTYAALKYIDLIKQNPHAGLYKLQYDDLLEKSDRQAIKMALDKTATETFKADTANVVLDRLNSIVDKNKNVIKETFIANKKDITELNGKLVELNNIFISRPCACDHSYTEEDKETDLLAITFKKYTDENTNYINKRDDLGNAALDSDRILSNLYNELMAVTKTIKNFTISLDTKSDEQEMIKDTILKVYRNELLLGISKTVFHNGKVTTPQFIRYIDNHITLNKENQKLLDISYINKRIDDMVSLLDSDEYDSKTKEIVILILNSIFNKLIPLEENIDRFIEKNNEIVIIYNDFLKTHTDN